MTGIAALAAAAAATSKITSATTGTTSNVTAVASGGQTIKVVQASPGSVIAGKPIQGGQTAIIGGQTVRLASPGGTTLLKAAGNTLTGQGGKQIILQKQGTQPQIVTLVKTSQGMQVATVPKVQGAKTVTAGPQIIQTSATGSKTAIPQGATIVKLVNAPGTAGLAAGKSPQIVKSIGAGNVVTLAKPGQTVAGKQTIVINKPGAQGTTTLKGAQGQQIIMVSSAGGLKQLSGGTATMSQAAGNSGVKMIVVSSGQLAQTTSKPITISMPGGQKTVTLAAGGGAKGGQIVQTSSGQILQLPAGGIMAGGKPVTVQMAGGGQKTLTLVQAPKQEATSGGNASADAVEAAEAAESIKVEEEKPPQVDGGVATPPNEPIDIEELNKLGMFFSQLDGVDDEDEQEAAKDSTEASAEGANTSESDPAALMESTDAAKESEEKDLKQETLDLPMEDLSSKDDNESATEAQKDKPSDEPVKTEPKDPLAQAMDAVTGKSILSLLFEIPL